jgi:hypothetical protein
MSKLIMFIFCIVSVIAGENQAISFTYGILGQLKSNPDSTVILSDSSVIHTGDRVRINIGYPMDSDFLLIFKDSQGEFDIFYPDPSKKGSKPNETAEQDTIYATALSWAQFSDPPGYETFYLINSKTSLNEMNDLVRRYKQAPDKAKLKLANRIQGQIDALDPNIKGDLALIPSRLDEPMAGGVAFRGEDDETLKDMSLTHICNGFNGIAFQKIILIHR